jgi:hypothetical protein
VNQKEGAPPPPLLDGAGVPLEPELLLELEEELDDEDDEEDDELELLDELDEELDAGVSTMR